MKPTFSGNIATFENLTRKEMFDVITSHSLCTFHVCEGDNDLYNISFPMDSFHRLRYENEIRFHNHQQKALDTKNGKPDNEPPKGPQPPSGGTPRGAKVVELKTTNAIAA